MRRAVALGLFASALGAALGACIPKDWPEAEPIAYDASACEPYNAGPPNPNYVNDAAPIDSGSLEDSAPVDAADAADATDAADAPDADASVLDSGAIDSGPVDSGAIDSGAIDSTVTTIPFDAGAPVARTDVDDILALSCSFSSCHGRRPDGVGNLYIPLRSEADWYTHLVKAPAHELPAMFVVAPGDPQNSWLVQKLAGGSCSFLAQCKNHDCGDRMPAANDAIDPDDLDTIVRWIRQGARSQ